MPSTTPLAKPAPTKIVVLPMQVTGIDADAARVLEELLLQSLRATGTFSVLGRSDLDAMIGLENLKDKLGCDDTTCAAELGGALGVNRIIASHVAKLGDSIIVVLKLIDAEHQTVIGSVKHKARNDPNTYDASVDAAVNKLLGNTSEADGTKQPPPVPLPFFIAAGNPQALYRPFSRSHLRLEEWEGVEDAGTMRAWGVGAAAVAAILAPSWGIYAHAWSNPPLGDADAGSAYRGGSWVLGTATVMSAVATLPLVLVSVGKGNQARQAHPDAAEAIDKALSYHSWRGFLFGSITGTAVAGSSALIAILSQQLGATPTPADWGPGVDAGLVSLGVGVAGVVISAIGLSYVDLDAPPEKTSTVDWHVQPTAFIAQPNTESAPGVSLAGTF